jgi:adenine-specific DNA-methyltransferase
MSLDLFGAEGAREYLARQLIAYIGNKRRLLPFLSGIIRQEAEGLQEAGGSRTLRFLDPFAGSGAVARLARSMGMLVMASDSEEYARVLNSAFLCVSPRGAEEIAAAYGGMGALLARYNGLHPERGGKMPAREYFARHYAPARTEEPRLGEERLFYTRENALFLDAAREALDEDFPGAADAGEGAPAGSRLKCILLALLIYEAATHANTSGVFKAYHRGFGGHSGEALKRIMAPMELERPALIEGPCAVVERSDAARFCASRSADICYLDPPYNQHQYGSNYHILNSLALHDRLPVSERRDAEGRLLDKAGIPERWKETRSPYCSRSLCPQAFKELFEAIDAPVIVMSYGEEGSMPLDELVELLSDRADVETRSTGYVAYRGGRQSEGRSSASSEFALVARRRKGNAPKRSDALPSLASAKLLARLPALLAEVHKPQELSKHFALSGSYAFWKKGGLALRIIGNCVFARVDLDGISKETLVELASILESTKSSGHAESCAVLARSIGEGSYGEKEGRILRSRFLRSLRKLAHRKYADEMRAACDEGRAAASAISSGQRAKFLEGLRAIERLAEKRTKSV